MVEVKYIAEIKLDENRTTCIDCPLCNSDDYCTLQDEDDLFLNDGWDYQLSNCPLIEANDNAKEDLELAQAVKLIFEQQNIIAIEPTYDFMMNLDGSEDYISDAKELINWHREQKESASNATKQEQIAEVVSCFECVHYRQSQAENECKATGDYCYPAHNVTECEYFERA